MALISKEQYLFDCSIIWAKTWTGMRVTATPSSSGRHWLFCCSQPSTRAPSWLHMLQHASEFSFAADAPSQSCSRSQSASATPTAGRTCSPMNTISLSVWRRGPWTSGCSGSSGVNGSSSLKQKGKELEESSSSSLCDSLNKILNVVLMAIIILSLKDWSLLLCLGYM